MTALPDFGAPLTAPSPHDTVRLYYPYNGGPFTVLPDRLAVAARPDGSPSLSLVLLRGAVPGLPPEPYGVLDLKMMPVYQLDEALARAREHRPGATVVPFTLAGGFLSFRSPDPTTPFPRELSGAVPLMVDGLDGCRISLVLSETAAALAERTLAGGGNPVEVRAEVEYAGMAPRIPALVRFDPATMVASFGSGSPVIGYHDLRSLLETSLDELPIQVLQDESSSRALLAETLVDRIRANYATLEPGSLDSSQPRLRLSERIQSGDVTWDLSTPVRTHRPLVLEADPFLRGRDHSTAHDGAGVVTRRVIPPISAGEVTVTVWANLPPIRLGVLRLGVELIADPRPPWRPQQARVEAPFVAPEDTARLTLRLAPMEPAEYTSVAYAVVPGLGNAALRGPVVSRRGNVLRFGPEDFPVAMIPVRADPELLAVSMISAVFVPANPAIPRQEIELRADQPAVAFAQPRTDPSGTLTFRVCPHDGASPLTIGPAPASPTVLTLASLPSYGPQQVEVRAVFPDPGPDAVRAVQLVPEGRSEEDQWITTLALTPDRPTRIWRYLPTSPFHAGYRWRVYHRGISPQPWSPVLPSSQPCLVDVAAAAPVPPPNDRTARSV